MQKKIAASYGQAKCECASKATIFKKFLKKKLSGATKKQYSSYNVYRISEVL
jgi:hypothetical protein